MLRGGGWSATARTAKGCIFKSAWAGFRNSSPFHFVIAGSIICPPAPDAPEKCARPCRLLKAGAYVYVHYYRNLCLHGATGHTAVSAIVWLFPKTGWSSCSCNCPRLSCLVLFLFSPWQPSCREHAWLPRRWHPASGTPSRAAGKEKAGQAAGACQNRLSSLRKLGGRSSRGSFVFIAFVGFGLSEMACLGNALFDFEKHGKKSAGW